LFTAVKLTTLVTDAAIRMSEVRSRYGLLVSALGAIVLIVSVFLPWYEVTSTLHAGAGAGVDVGHRLATVSAFRALRDVDIVLLVLAALAILDALAPLAPTGRPLPGGAGGSVVLLGAVAATFVLFRMLAPPPSVVGVAELSLREGAWLALLGSLAIALGGMWPRSIGFLAPSAGRAPGAWSGLPG
jgi:hypothetical protein